MTIQSYRLKTREEIDAELAAFKRSDVGAEHDFGSVGVETEDSPMPFVGQWVDVYVKVACKRCPGSWQSTVRAHLWRLAAVTHGRAIAEDGMMRLAAQTPCIAEYTDG